MRFFQGFVINLEYVLVWCVTSISFKISRFHDCLFSSKFTKSCSLITVFSVLTREKAKESYENDPIIKYMP